LTALTAAIIIGMLNLDAAFDDTTMENLIDQAIDNLEDKLKGSFKAHSPTIIKKKSESPIKDEMRTGN